MYIRFNLKYPLFLSDFIETSIFRQSFEKYPIKNLMIIHPAGAELFQAGGRADMTKLIFILRKFANAPETSFRRKLLTMSLLRIGQCVKTLL